MDLSALAPSATALLLATALDLAIGDPVYAWHPVRLIGRSLTFIENFLRRIHLDGYAGGILLFILLSAMWMSIWSGLILLLAVRSPLAGMAVHTLLLYSLIALKDLIRHAGAVGTAADRNDLAGARHAISRLVGRDTSCMDLAACRRAAIESISENLTDGFLSPIAWYAVAGIPGIVLFKVVSTMDSMVGYKTPRYLKFGWCGARTDDVMNFLPARLSWLLIALVAAVLPGCSATKTLTATWNQHAIVPGPNSGWSEAAVAGAIQRRLIGPIWNNGALVTEIWLGIPEDPEAGSSQDLSRGSRLVVATALFFVALTSAILAVAI